MMSETKIINPKLFETMLHEVIEARFGDQDTDALYKEIATFQSCLEEAIRNDRIVEVLMRSLLPETMPRESIIGISMFLGFQMAVASMVWFELRNG